MFEVAVRASSHIRAGELALTLACAHLAFLACGGGTSSVGESCGQSDDCQTQLQCFDGICTPRCKTHVDCGDGYACQRGGECQQSEGAIGDRCSREIDCGPALACLPDAEDQGNDGILTGTCQVQLPGLELGAECEHDAACQIGICTLGHCTAMCTQFNDCPPKLTCAQVPRILADSAPRFGACLSRRGVIADDLPLEGPSGTVLIPVPSHAESFALVAEVDDPSQLVAVSQLSAPNGTTLYLASTDPEDFYADPIRYQPGRGVSTLFVSNTPSVNLVVGVYRATVGSEIDVGQAGTATPRVQVLYKVDTGTTLDLHVHFMNLESHPCAAAFDVGGRLDAAAAAESPAFADFLAEIGSVLAAGGIQMGDVTYADIRDQARLDGIERDQAGALFALAEQEIGINIFFVRSLAPAGVEAVVGGTPGPPRTTGTPASGLAIGVDTLCYRTWTELARIAAHAVARQMGLYYNRDPGGHPDTIDDSDELSANLLYFTDTGGASLSEGQGEVLRRYPGLR